LIGFFKANSKVSLISSSVFAAVLVLTQTGIFDPTVARNLVNVLLAAAASWCSPSGWPRRRIHAERIDAGADHPDAGAGGTCSRVELPDRVKFLARTASDS